MLVVEGRKYVTLTAGVEIVVSLFSGVLICGGGGGGGGGGQGGGGGHGGGGGGGGLGFGSVTAFCSALETAFCSDSKRFSTSDEALILLNTLETWE